MGEARDVPGGGLLVNHRDPVIETDIEGKAHLMPDLIDIPHASATQERPALPEAVQIHLGQQLRALYFPVEQATLDRFSELLNRLGDLLTSRGDALTTEVRAGLVKTMPQLRAFALSLTKNPTLADDLVQETLMKGWKNGESYQAGTNLEAWLFMILRNIFYSHYRKSIREVEDPDDTQAARLSVPPNQGNRVDVQDMYVAMSQLPREQRKALTLIVLNEMSYWPAS